MLPQLIKAQGRRAAELVCPAYLVRRHHARFGAEEIEMSVLDLIVPKGREAIDAGANWGTYAAILSRLASQVHCLEPNPRLARLLVKSVAANCTVRQAAAGPTAGTAVLHIPRQGARSLDGLASLMGSSAAKADMVEVPVVALDSYADRDIGFVKIDVEGFELEVLAGARQLILRQKPVILIEVEERHVRGGVQRVYAVLCSLGYECWFIDQGKLKPFAAFDAAVMQNTANLNGAAPRATQRYVNNFIYVPPGTMTDAKRADIEARLAV
jgi:FkbM family methyltransferase